ncbi:ABC transporter substrate-binding protein [Rhabdaerophilum sp. SD176]|uniref:ABC transporter substrate-binding protein n=1 Tax=Rhabdaerophilum sp. SD176 TaxID=2983548 RepID=UPI0024DFDCED|nr:ABC transporter substrate-binding protein [Rhabdaerophilum sp. SD176]
MSVTRRRFSQGLVAAPFVVTTPHAFAQTDRRPTLTVAVAQLPKVLEPALELNNVGTRVTYSVFDTVIRRDFKGSPDGGGSALLPHLATSWKRESSQSLLVSFRDDVMFHDGAKMTAEDVAYTFRNGRLWGEKAAIPGGRAFFGTLSEVEAVDRNTVRFKTRIPDVLLEQRLASWCSWIVSKRHYEQVGIEGFGKNPIGTGPFRFSRARANEFMEFEAHDAYWMGRPNARRVTFREVPELSTRIAGLVSGEFDLITNVPPDQLTVLQGYKDVDARSVVLANSHLLTFDARSPQTNDRRIRQALGLAIDRKKLVDSLWLGKAAIPASHNYPEFGDMFLPGRALSFDPTKAKALLKDAGYKGEPITYRTMPNYYTAALDAAQIIVEMWKAVGINAQLQVVESFAQMQSAGQQVGNTSNSTRFPDPLGALWISWGPNSEFQRSKAFDPGDAAAFNTLGKALESETDPAKRKALFASMLDAWEDACPATILYQPFESYGVKKKISWKPYSFFFMDLRPDNLSFA